MSLITIQSNRLRSALQQTLHAPAILLAKW